MPNAANVASTAPWSTVIRSACLDQHPRPRTDRQRVRLHVQHDPAGELLVNGLLGVARQTDGFRGLHEVGRRVVLPEQTRHADGEEVRLAGIGADWLEDDPGEARAFSDIGWEIYPDGLRRQLARFAQYGVPLLVTENGLATTDEELRLAFLRNHLRSLAEAVAAGVPVAGYLYWSLIDNFEWSAGTAPRFGLAATDFATQERTPRPAAAYFAKVCKANALPDESSKEDTAQRTG